MRTRIFIASGLFFALVAHADFSLQDWAYTKAITLPAEYPSGSYAKVGVDREVSIQSADDLRDLRVIANGALEVPYQLVVENASAREEYTPTTMVDNSSQGGETMFILDLGTSGVLNDHLRIISPTKNFKRKVAVYAADTSLTHSDPSWRKLTDAGYIYNFSDTVSGFDSGSGEVHYPPSTARFLRVVIGSGEGADVVVSAANVFRSVGTLAQENRIETPAVILENAERKTTEISVDLGASGLTTHRVTLVTGDTKNFDRRAVVQSSTDGKNWRALSDGYVFRLRTPRFTGDQLGLAYPETPDRYLRVLVANADDTPVAWDAKVIVESIARSVVFLPTPGMSYALYYGNQRAMLPRYDIARYLQYYESTILPNASLGVTAANPAYIAPVPPATQDPATGVKVLDVVLVFLVAITASLTLLYLKKLKTSHRGER